MRNKLLTMFLLGMILTLMFGYTRNWIESTPTDTTVANLIDDYNRNVRVDTAERLEDYVAGFVSGDSNAGFYHVLFIEKSASPSTPAENKYLLYGKLVGGKCELHGMDEDGDEKQITSGGVLKISAGDFDANSIDEDDIELSNDSWLKAKNNAGDGDANLIKLNTSDIPIIATDAELQTAIDASDNDNAITDKKYVDDQIGTYAKFGSWSTLATVTNSTDDNVDVAATEATTDGILVCVITSSLSGEAAEALGYTDSSNPPTTLRGVAPIGDQQGAKILNNSYFMPVKKGEYYKAVYNEVYGGSQTTTRTYYWIPIGS